MVCAFAGAMKYLRTQVVLFLWHSQRMAIKSRYYPCISLICIFVLRAGAAEGNGYYILQDWGRPFSVSFIAGQLLTGNDA